MAHHSLNNAPHSIPGLHLLPPQCSLDQAELISRLQHFPRTLSAIPEGHLLVFSFPKPVISQLAPKRASSYFGGRQMVCMDRDGCAHWPELELIFSKAGGGGRGQRIKSPPGQGATISLPPNAERQLSIPRSVRVSSHPGRSSGRMSSETSLPCPMPQGLCSSC